MMVVVLRNHLFLLLSVFSFLVSLSVPALAECDCNAEDNVGADKSATLKLKYIGITVVLFSSAVGVLIPFLGRRWPALQSETDAFFVGKAFAAGVILATGMVHILPDAFESLTSPCLPKSPWGKFPFAGFVAMLSALATLMIDTYATSYCQRKHLDNEEEESTAAADWGHAHGAAGTPLPLKQEWSVQEHIRHRVVTQVLELGIVVHSVIIGIAVGTSMQASTIRPLIGALCFHQLFEGIGLAGCMVQAKFKVRATFIMALFFSFTTPVGIAVGIAVTSRYNENSTTALTVEGLLNSVSAGILVYMALVDLLAADFLKPRMQKNGRLRLEACVALLLGAGFMSIIAMWA